MDANTSITISFAITIILAIISLANFMKANKKDVTQDEKDRVTQDVKTNMKLDELCNTTRETRTDIKSLSNTVTQLSQDITIIKRDSSRMWNRIDDLAEDVKKLKVEVAKYENKN